MPKIPVYERQYQFEESAATATKALAAPTPSKPEKEAFGEGIAKAQGESGKLIQNIGNVIAGHVIEQRQQENQQAVLDAETGFRKKLQDIVYNDELDSNGNVVRQGILNRQLGSAKGADEELATETQKLKEEYGKDLKWPGQQELFGKLADSHYIGVRDTVLRHESQQLNASKLNSLNSSLDTSIDEVGKNPNPSIIETAMKHDQKAIKVFMKAQGFDDATINAKISDHNDKLIASVLDNVVRLNNDYKLGDAILEKYKAVISPKIYDAAKLDIKEKGLFDKQMIYNQAMFANYGMNLAGADKAILADKTLTGPDKERQLSAYHSFFNMKHQEQNIADENAIKGAMSYLDALHQKTLGIPGDGYSQAMSYANSLPIKTKQHILPLVEQLFGATNVKTDPAAWYELYDKIKDGQITNKWAMMKEFGTRISFSDMKSFITAVDSGTGPLGSQFDKFSITAAVDKVLKDKGAETPEDHAQMWEYLGAKADDFFKTNARKPTPTEQIKMLKDAMDEIVVGKAWLGDKKMPAYKVPFGAIYDPNVDAVVKRDANGNWVKWKPQQ